MILYFVEFLNKKPGSLDLTTRNVSYIQSKNDVSNQHLIKSCTIDPRKILTENIDG